MLERKVEVRVRERRVGEEEEKPSREGVLRKCIVKQGASPGRKEAALPVKSSSCNLSSLPREKSPM